LSKRAEKK